MDREVFDQNRFESTRNKLLNLKGRLAHDDVNTLAREVLRRVSRSAGLADPQIALQQNKEIEELARLLIDDDPAHSAAFVERLQVDGQPVERIYLFYLAGAAVRLGALWDNDELPSWKVTLGTSRIYAILRSIRRTRRWKPVTRSHSILFASVPGDDHTLGVQMAADLFREKGWDVQLMLDRDHDDLVDALERSETVLLGLSASAVMHASSLARLLIALRISVPDLRVLVSGQIVTEAADLVSLMEPDSMVDDVPRALREFDRLAAEAAAEAARMPDWPET